MVFKNLFKNPFRYSFSANTVDNPSLRKLDSFKNDLREKGMFLFGPIRNRLFQTKNGEFPLINRIAGKVDFKKIFLALAVFLLAIGIVILGKKFIMGSSAGNKQDKIQVKGAKAVQDVQREFPFPLKDEKGNKVSELKYFLERVELRDEIIVKGQRATSISGRTFLIVNLKIINSYNQSVEVNTKDYIRLSVNGSEEEWLAPDIHNDPVAVQAISTKYTRVGFPINDTDSNLVLRIGEIDGDKEKISLELK